MGRIISIKVIPNSRKDEVVEGNPLVVRVKEPAERGKANQTALKLLAKHFHARVRMISGHTSRRKIVELTTE